MWPWCVEGRRSSSRGQLKNDTVSCMCVCVCAERANVKERYDRVDGGAEKVTCITEKRQDRALHPRGIVLVFFSCEDKQRRKFFR